MSGRVWLWLGAVLCVAAGISLLLVGGLPHPDDYAGYRIEAGYVAPVMGAIAPPFSLPVLADESLLMLDDLRGSPVIINFWATWCAPCIIEMPELQRLYARYSGQGLRVVGVNLGEEAPVVQAWVEQLAITYDIGLDSGAVALSYRLRGQPQTVIVSPDGIITQIIYGAASYDTLEAAIAPFVEQG